ncbi:MAG: M28 family peptidase, partial [Planctomycetota bacterium]
GAWGLISDSGRKTTTKIRRAIEAGAIGVLLTPGPDYDRAPYAERYGAATARAIEGSLASPLSRVPTEREGPPVLLVPRQTAGLLAARAGLLPSKWVEAGRRTGASLEERRAVVTEELSSPNVAALLRGSDPQRAGELIILCAHLDHLGRRGEDLFPGADDNASGSVGLLALAEALVARGPLDRSVLFLWVTGEEAGLWGSAAWCADPQLPEGLEPRLAFNLDMIGRDDPEELWLTPTSEHPEFNPAAALVEELAPLEGFTHLVSQDSYWSASDHYSFATRLRIPVVYLSSGEHDEYHTPADTADLIDVDKLVRIVRLHLRLLERTPTLKF